MWSRPDLEERSMLKPMANRRPTRQGFPSGKSEGAKEGRKVNRAAGTRLEATMYHLFDWLSTRTACLQFHGRWYVGCCCVDDVARVFQGDMTTRAICHSPSILLFFFFFLGWRQVWPIRPWMHKRAGWQSTVRKNHHRDHGSMCRSSVFANTPLLL